MKVNAVNSQGFSYKSQKNQHCVNVVDLEIAHVLYICRVMNDMLCYDLLYYAMLCLCYDMLCYAMLWYDMLCYA